MKLVVRKAPLNMSDKDQITCMSITRGEAQSSTREDRFRSQIILMLSLQSSQKQKQNLLPSLSTLWKLKSHLCLQNRFPLFFANKTHASSSTTSGSDISSAHRRKKKYNTIQRWHKLYWNGEAHLKSGQKKSCLTSFNSTNMSKIMWT